MYMASTSGSESSCSYDPYERSTPNRAANSSAWDCVREPTAKILCEDRCNARAMLDAIPPGARTPQRSGGASYGSGIRDVGSTDIMTGRLQRGHRADFSSTMSDGLENSRGPRSYSSRPSR
jgi:hypothetical protein